MHRAADKMFGVIKRECFAIELNKENNEPEILKPGILIQIVSDYGETGCHFKIRNFTNWLDKYKTAIYKCEKDDYIVVTMELWPYLLPLQNDEGRVNFVQNVNSGEFHLDMLKLGREIRIRRQFGTEVKYFVFMVTHNGAMKEIDIGYYIGLQLKNENVSLPSDLKYLSQYYRFGGIGIVVPADWVMINLYKHEDSADWTMLELSKEDQCQLEPPPKIQQDDLPSVDMEVGETAVVASELSNFQSVRQPSTLINEPKKRHATYSKPLNYTAKVEVINNAEGSVNDPNFTEQIEKISNADGSVKNAEKTKCELCDKTVEVGQGVILRECIHSFCTQCIYRHVEMNSKCLRICCPYKKDYVCQFDLLDGEIKDVGGDLIYNKILENRLNEYLATDRNARVCPNETCKAVWTSTRKNPRNNEQCPKCNTNWCNICSSAHEPGTRHGKKLETKHVSALSKKKQYEIEPQCDKCHKSNIPRNLCATLQNCQHTFCNACIVPMIKTQTSGSQYPQCTICKKIIADDEVRKIVGFEVLQLFIDSRNKQPEVASPIEICYCKPLDANCFIVLKCKHKFCCTFLMRNLQNPLHSKSRAACPTCHEEIDKNRLKELRSQMNNDAVVKCQTCSNQPDVHLTKCQHSFCHKCVLDMLWNQVSDQSKPFIRCTTCHDLITDSDIYHYGNDTIFALFKSRIEAVKVAPNAIDHIKHNDRSFECLSCEKWVQTNHGVMLPKCRHSICLLCFNKLNGPQLSNSQIPICPFCTKLFKPFEVEAIIAKSADSSILFDCLKCEEKFDEHLIQKCLNCASSVCLKCAKSTISSQTANNNPLKCVFCPTFDASDLTFTVQKERETRRDELVNSYSFECLVCHKPADRASQIALTKCKHEICCTCLHELISEQRIHSILSQCPICMTDIDQTQLEALGISTTNKEAVQPGQMEKSSLKIFKKSVDKLQITSIPNATFTVLPERETRYNEPDGLHSLEIPFQCLMCAQRTDQVVLSNCKHEICRMCVNENIEISGQEIMSSTQQCPICAKHIDQIPLDPNGASTTVLVKTILVESSQSHKSSSKIFGDTTR